LTVRSSTTIPKRIAETTSHAAFALIKGEVVADPGGIAPALKRAIQATRDGKPYLLDVLVAQAGQGANLNWYPKVSVAEMRTRKV